MMTRRKFLQGVVAVVASISAWRGALLRVSGGEVVTFTVAGSRFYPNPTGLHPGTPVRLIKDTHHASLSYRVETADRQIIGYVPKTCILAVSRVRDASWRITTADSGALPWKMYTVSSSYPTQPLT